MRCCVISCNNNDSMAREDNEITFHLFPKDPKQRAAWIESLGLKDRQLVSRAVVCSNHFRPEHLMKNKAGVRRVLIGAVPVVDPSAPSEPTQMKICKICLTSDAKMYDMTEIYSLPYQKDAYKLDQMYEYIVGKEVNYNDNKYPRQVCWECAARLYSCSTFKSKALLSEKLLQDMFTQNVNIDPEQISSYHLQYKILKSPLVMTECMNDDLIPETAPIEVLTQVIPVIPVKTEQNNVNRNIDPMEIEISDINDQQKIIKDEEEIPLVMVSHEDVKTEVDLVPNNIEMTSQIEELIQFNIGDEFEQNDSVDVSDYDMSANDFNDDNRVVELENNAMVFSEVFVHTPKVEKEKVKPESVDTEKPMKDLETPKRGRKKKKPYVKPKLPIDENIFTIKSLTVEEQIAEIESRKDSEKFILSAFKCYVCYKGFPTEDKYHRHAIKHTEERGSIECSICKIRVKKPRILRAHVGRSHSEEFICKQCPLVTRSRTVALGHVKFHNGKKYQCPQCPLEFEKQTTRLNHLRLKHICSFVCELCGYTFVSKIGVRSHKRMRHVTLVDKDIKLEGPYCKVCDVKFLTKKAYEKHLRLSAKHIESEDDPNRLSNDPSIKSRRIGLMRKKAERRDNIRPKDPNDRILKPNDPVDCEQCGLQLKNLHAYAMHFKTDHPGINRTKFPHVKNPYMCDQCGKMFLNTTCLENHMWVHTGEKRYQCDHCNKTFSVKANLAGHMRLHETTRKSYACRICGKLFAFPFNRTRHMFLHTGLKPFKCDACEKSFVTSGELRAHVDYVHLKKPRPKRVRRKPRKCDITGLEY